MTPHAETSCPSTSPALLPEVPRLVAQPKLYVRAIADMVGVSKWPSVATATRCGSWSQDDWIKANTRMLHFLAGVPLSVVPDNLNAAVERPGAVPLVQRDYARWAHHYGASVLPARSRKPRDKALVERTVALIQQHMLPELAEQTFMSFEGLDAEVQRLLKTFNTKGFSNVERGSRLSQFETVERARLNDLPLVLFVYAADVATRTVPSDYHIEVEGRRYSGHTCCSTKVTVRAAGCEMVFLHDGIAVARHARASGPSWNRAVQILRRHATGTQNTRGACASKLKAIAC